LEVKMRKTEVNMHRLLFLILAILTFSVEAWSGD